jgi:cytochrome c553
MRSCILAVVLLSSGISLPALAQGADQPADVTKNCESCHGPAGNSTTPSTPRLNGQLPAYIVGRLRELTDLTRNSPHATAAMYDIAHMKDTLKAAVADYFSHQTPTPGQPQAGKLAALGRQVYTNGDPTNGVPACQTCHGANAEGQGNAPRLAGQRRDYLNTQLWNFNFALRVHQTMNVTAARLGADQIDGLVAYLGAD